MPHHFFFRRIISGAPTVNDHYPRPGDYTIDGQYVFYINVNTEVLYLFDATAKTAVGNADFVMIQLTRESAIQTYSAQLDTQGDAGSGALLAAGTGTGTAKNVVWSVYNENEEFEGGYNQWDVGSGFLILPASLFGTTDTTRTGMVIRGVNSNVPITFTFCSWNPSSGL